MPVECDRNCNWWIRLKNRLLSSRKVARELTFLGLALVSLLCITLHSSAFAYFDSVDERTATYSFQNSHFLSATPNDSSFALLEGQQKYSAGQLSAALQSWRQAAESLDSRPVEQAIALSYVSIAAQDLGDWQQAEDAIREGLSLVANSASIRDEERVRAQVLNTQGRFFLRRGQPEMAWETWQQAEAAYAQAQDEVGRIGAQINQSQALQTMGFYRRARLKLEEVAKKLEEQPDSRMKAITFKSLGTVFQTAGSLSQSQQYLSKSRNLYHQLGDEIEEAQVLFALANTFRLMQENESAQQFYLQAESYLPEASTLKTQSQLNRFRLLLDIHQWQTAKRMLPDLLSKVSALPDSRQAVYSRVNLVESLLNRSDEDQRHPMTWLSLDSVVDLLKGGLEQADRLEDKRAQASSLGELSKVYDYAQQWSDSQVLAQRALALSQSESSQDMAYRWQQQLGKAYHQQGKDEDAIASYSNAVKTLKLVRRDLLATNADVQYSFKTTVEPIYRELVSLLLLPESASQEALSQARDVIEELQLAEIENYFRSACVDSASASIDNLDDSAATIYPIVLPNRLEVVASLPGLPLRHYRFWQTEQETNKTIGKLYQYLNPVFSERERLLVSKEIYDWLITPVEPLLSENKIETLVFVLDGQFRRIPMAALHSGENYLLERYSVALTPGLKLLGPHFQDPKPLQALIMGLAESRNGFAALPGVRTEIEQVAASVNAEILFDEEFTREKLADAVDRLPYPILHLATHGQFSSDLEETFLLAWDRKISVGDLDGLLRSRRENSVPIELMVLSACQTAEGDDRAALGLAGMAIQSGARSTVASLWSVNDGSTAALMTAFYEELSNASVSKAEALRKAQIKILQDPEYSHPYYWSSFVLIGNWLS